MPDFDDFDDCFNDEDYSLSDDFVDEAEDDGWFDSVTGDDYADAQEMLDFAIREGDATEAAYWQRELNRLADLL